MSAYLDRAVVREVLDLQLPVAAPDDLLQAKVDAAMEPTRKGSKRIKDFADIRRLVDAYPKLRDRVPSSIAPLVFFDEGDTD